MKIALLKLSLHNFKGIKDFTFEPQGKNISVYGDNGTGKTTLCDAWNWLLFGKDSHDSANFTVQPLDKQNNIIHMLDTEVEGVLSIGGKNVTLKKVLKEKWVKKRGATESELKGTETSYYIDEVPAKQSEYKQYISNIIDEQIFKLITNPMYFSMGLSWQERRKILFDIGGNVDDTQVIASKPSLKPLAELLGDKNIDTLKKLIAVRLKKLNKDKEDIPSRVDELQRTIQELDFDALDFQRRSIVAGIKNIDAKLSGADSGNVESKKRLYMLQDKLMNIKQDVKSEIAKSLCALQGQLLDLQAELKKNERRRDIVQTDNAAWQKEIEHLARVNEDLRKQWKEEYEKALVFSDDVFACPTCGRPFEDEDVEAKKQELQEAFNRNKAEKLKTINAQGKANKAKIESLKQEIADNNIETCEANIKGLAGQIDEIQQKIDNFNAEPDYSGTDYEKVKDEIASLQEKLKPDDNTEFKLKEAREQRSRLDKELEGINSQLAYKEANEKAKARIKELEKEEKDISQQIADLQKQQDLCDAFVKEKVTLLEDSINSMFKHATFKLFRQQINGGIEECCEVLYGGVPFSTNLNSGSKIKAGIDIINTLCRHYAAYAPIWIDNRESVTKVIPTDSQVISLVVSEKDKTLRAERG